MTVGIKDIGNQKHTIFFDIETVAREVPEHLVEEKRAKLAEEFVKEDTINGKLESWKASWAFTPGASQPICIGAISTEDDDPFLCCSSDEAFLGSSFSSYLDDHSGRLVGFNIRKFDLPMIVGMLSRSNTKLRHPFGKFDIIDLMKEPFGFDTGMYSLSHYAHVFNLPHKTAKGSDVADMWKQDQEDNGTRVAEYCMSDVMTTKALYEAYQRFYKF